MAFVGIDIGTSFIKGAVLDQDARTFRHIRRLPFPQPLPRLHPLFYEHDPEEILNAVTECIRDLVDLAGTCDGLVMCNQMHSMVLMDRDGKARSNCIGWRDQRSLMEHPSFPGTYYELYTSRLSEAQRRSLGNERPVATPATFLFWFAEQGLLEPGISGVALGSFVLSELCDAAPAVEPTNAMAYELLDLTRLTWHEEVLTQLGLQASNLPALSKQGAVVGRFQYKGQQIPCYAAVGDYQCALAGAMLNRGDLSLNISTGSQVSRVNDTLALGDFQTRPFFDGKFTSTVTHLPAGRALNLLVDLLTELPRLAGAPVADPWRWIAQAAEAVHETDLQAKISFFPGPRGSPGNISNIGEKNFTVGSLFRAAFADMADNYYACALQIAPERSWQNIVLSGGLAHKLPLLRRSIEDRFGMETELCEITEDTLSGLLMMALVFGGTVSSVDEARAAVEAAHHHSVSQGGNDVT